MYIPEGAKSGDEVIPCPHCFKSGAKNDSGKVVIGQNNLPCACCGGSGLLQGKLDEKSGHMVFMCIRK